MRCARYCVQLNLTRSLAPPLACQLRKKYGDDYEKKFGSKLSFLSVFVRASISALQARPIVNAVIDGTDIVYRDYIDVSIGVASASGIVRRRLSLIPIRVSEHAQVQLNNPPPHPPNLQK